MNIFLNKTLVPESDALVSVYDHGFLYGDGIYETMRAYNGVVFMLEKHLERLCRSASMTKLSIPETGFITDAVFRTIEANKLSDAYVRVTVSRVRDPSDLILTFAKSRPLSSLPRISGNIPNIYTVTG